MKFEELSKEDQDLLNTDLGDFDKYAQEEVALAQEMYQTGFEKLASETADYIDEMYEMQKKAEEDKEEEKEDEEQEKKASDLSAFIERGYFDGLVKEGTERHGDAMYYLYPFIEEKVAAKAAKGALSKLWETTKGKAKDAWGATKEKAKGGYEGFKGYHTGAASEAKKGWKKAKGAWESKPGRSNAAKEQRKDKMIAGAKGMAMGAGKLVGPYAGLAGAGYGAHKLLKKKEEN